MTGFLDVIDREAGVHYTLIDFAARAVGGTLRAGSDATAARWVPLAEAIEMVEWAQTRRLLRRACSGPPVLPGES